MPAAIEQIAHREVEKLARSSPAATEYTIGVNYLQYLASLPWNTMTEDNLDIERAKEGPRVKSITAWWASRTVSWNIWRSGS